MPEANISKSPVTHGSSKRRRCITPKNLTVKRSNTLNIFEENPQSKRICNLINDYEIRTGTVIGNYRVVQSLAHGSYSRIYLATRGENKYVIKIQEHLLEQHKEDNIRESLVLNKIREYNATEFLIHCVETFEFGPNYCFVMEKLDFSLHEFFLMNRHKPLELKKVIHIISQLCDFGFSIPSEQIKDYRGPVQTVCYRAPEVILGLPLCERVDTWSIGCVLFKLYTGLELFKARDEVEMLRQTRIVTGLPAESKNGRHKSEFLAKTDKGSMVLRNCTTTKIYPMKYTKKGFKGLEKLGHNYLTTGTFTELDFAIVRLISSCLQPDACRRQTAAEIADYIKFSVESFGENCVEEL